MEPFGSLGSDMDQRTSGTDHPKRRRRRKNERPPLSGWLTSSDQFKGNLGRISYSLFAELFRHQPTSGLDVPETCYVAITPWSPLADDLVEDAAWTILPVQTGEKGGEDLNEPAISSIQLPRDSIALQSFVGALQHDAFTKSNGSSKKGIEVRILDVEPLALDVVYVAVDGDALKKHDEVQKRFGGGFDYTGANGFAGKGKGKAKATSHSEVNSRDGDTQVQERNDQLTLAVREALATSMLIRQNDILPLPLPTHPITHAPFPPATIILCEPVHQGVLINTTRIVVNRVSHTDLANRSTPTLMNWKALQGMHWEDGNDTSNEQFFSAAENEEKQQTSYSDAPNCPSSSDDSTNDSDDSSDDSLQNMISMSALQLPAHNPSISSSKVATPRIGGPRTNGISTPGSVFSNFTATTARQGFRGKMGLFKARGLLSKIPDAILQPKPGLDEDDEARVFVDMKSLIKIGCFSGDWVRIEAASTPDYSRSRVWDGHLLHPYDDVRECRPLKVYGLSDISQNLTPRRFRGIDNGRRASITSAPGCDTAASTAWLSPILLANLGQTEFMKISPLLTSAEDVAASRARAKLSKVKVTSSPPVAKEMTLLRVSTPLSTERALQTGIFTALKQHFETKRRILRPRDLIALPVDVSMSKLLAQPTSVTDGDQEIDELLSLQGGEAAPVSSKVEVAWFRVGQISIPEMEDKIRLPSDDVWGGASCIEPMSTRMRQVGSEPSKIPPVLQVPWQLYLGARPQIRNLSPGRAIQKYASPIRGKFIAPLRRRLRELLAASTSPRALQLGMNPTFVLLHSTQRGVGKATLASGAASDLGIHVFELDAYDIIAEGGSPGDVKTEALLKARVERAMSCGPACTAILLRHVEALASDRMVTTVKEMISELRVIITTTTEIDSVPDGIRGLVTHELEVVAPDEGEREGILKSIIDDGAIKLSHDVELASIALKTAALVAGDLVDVVDRALVARLERLENLSRKGSPRLEGNEQTLIRDVLVSGGEQTNCVVKADFDSAVEAARKNFADTIGAPKIPNVSWEDVGGLENVKGTVMETIQLPLERPELFAKGTKKRSGILFYGPPGTGKTLLAKAIATEFSLNFFSVKGPELLNMYIGESEANVRRVFQRARDARPCVVFFDELDSVAPKRGNQGDSGGVMDRIVSQLLAELDGMSNGDEGAGGVFVIGATNRPDLLDQALLRPGRFDTMLYLGVSDTHDKQLTILEALTRKFTMHPDLSLRNVAGTLPFTYTGADLYALCSDAMLKAITRQASAVDAKIRTIPGGPVTTAYFFDHLATAEDIAVMVTEDDFSAAQRELIGSVRYIEPLANLYSRSQSLTLF